VHDSKTIIKIRWKEYYRFVGCPANERLI